MRNSATQPYPTNKN